MNPDGLIRLQAELEYGVAIHGNEITVTSANTRDVPKITIAQHSGGYTLLFRCDLPVTYRKTCESIGPADLFSVSGSDVNMLGCEVQRIVNCCWYCITRVPEADEFPDVVFRDGRFVIERDGRIAAQAWSAQSGHRADEVEVETDSDYRRRGFGRQCVAAWAHHVRREGKIALYSHLVTNEASRALAKSLRAWKYAETRELF